MTIITFEQHKKGRWLSGAVVCICCRHKWITSIEVSSGVPDYLECPSCFTMKGIFIFPVLPDVGEIVFFCNCGCEVGYHTKLGFVCFNCGALHDQDTFLGDGE